jgi:hypothetical protein
MIELWRSQKYVQERNRKTELTKMSTESRMSDESSDNEEGTPRMGNITAESTTIKAFMSWSSPFDPPFDHLTCCFLTRTTTIAFS